MFGISFGPKSVTVTEAHEKLGAEGHVLLDVRNEDEVKEMSVPGALNIPLGELKGRAGELSGFSSIHVMCRSGGRSARATEFLNKNGFPQAENVLGGITAWHAAGFPILPL